MLGRRGPCLEESAEIGTAQMGKMLPKHKQTITRAQRYRRKATTEPEQFM